MKQTTTLVLVIVLMSVAFGFVTGAVVLGPISIDVTLHSYTNGWTGGGCTGNLCSASPPKGPGGPGNLNDQSEYIASWSPNLIGQRVTVVPGIRSNGGLTNCATDAYHLTMRLTRWGGSPDPALVFDSDIGGTGDIVGDWKVIASAYWDIISPDGHTVIPEGAYVDSAFSWHCWLGGWYLGANQNSVIHTGIGNLHRNQDQVKVGDTASWSYHVGYISDPAKHLGWTFYVVSSCSGRTVVPETTLTQLDGSFSYKVVDADFSTSCPRNELHAYLKNELWLKAFDITTTITQEQLAHAPSCEIKSVSPQSPKQGESVTVAFGCSPASAASEDAIKRIIVTWGYGSDDHTATLAPDATEYQFVAGESGYARVIVLAYTANNVPSATRSVDIQVDHQVSNQFTAASGLIPLIAAAIILVIGLLVAVSVGKGKPLWFLFIFLLFAGAAVWAYVALGGAL